MTHMKTLTIGGKIYEIVDEKARANGGNADEKKVGEIVDQRIGEAGLATKDEVKLKADDILFTEDYRAGAAVGAFNVGDGLQNLTLREILAKILNATVKENVIEKIVRDEIPMLSGSSDGLEATEFNSISMTPEQASAAPTVSGFYQITTDGVVTESGYQLFTESTGRSNYAIALPEGVTIKRVYMWDDLTQSWLDYSPVLTETGTTTVDGCTYVTKYHTIQSMQWRIRRRAP